MNGIERIAAERERQIEVEGYTPEHDATHGGVGDLAAAAACYAYPDIHLIAHYWPDAWKTGPKLGARIRNLEKAGALIAAEIDRLLAAGEA